MMLKTVILALFVVVLSPMQFFLRSPPPCQKSSKDMRGLVPPFPPRPLPRPRPRPRPRLRLAKSLRAMATCLCRPLASSVQVLRMSWHRTHPSILVSPPARGLRKLSYEPIEIKKASKVSSIFEIISKNHLSVFLHNNYFPSITVRYSP